MLPKDDLARKIDTTNFEYILPEGSYALKKSNGAAKAANGNKDSKTKLDEYREGLRDYQNAQLSKLGKTVNPLRSRLIRFLHIKACSNEIRVFFFQF